MFNSSWPEPHIEALREGVSEGLSASKIAEYLNRKFHDVSYTRNAVIAKTHRLGIRIGANRPPAPPYVRRAVAAAAPKPLPPPPKPKVQIDPVPKDRAFDPLPGTTPVALFDLRHDHCRWPVGQSPVRVDGSDYQLETYCGCQAIEGRPYCPAHAATSRGGGGTPWVSKHLRERAALAFNGNSRILEAAE